MISRYAIARSCVLALVAGCGGGEAEAAAGGRSDAAHAAPAPAESAAHAIPDQGTFEGVITAKASGGGERGEHVMYVKAGRYRIDMNVNGERGSIIRDGDNRLLSIDHDERVYVYLPFPAVDSGDDDGVRFEPVGRSDTVAGHRCEYYRIRDPDGIQDGDQACVTTALGFVGFTPAGSLAPGDERRLRQQFGQGFAILKTLDRRNTVEFEVTRIEQRPVDDGLFAPPAGYTRLR